MKKMIMAAVAGLVLGVGGGTLFAIVSKPPALPPGTLVAADSLATDSAAHGDAADSAAVTRLEDGTQVAADSGHAGESRVVAVADDPVAPKPIVPPSVRSAAVLAQPADSTSVRLARIFGAMKPEEAAAVLSQLDDADVKAVLFKLSDRKAAEILARFPGDRAANLTRTLLTDARVH